MNNAIMITRNTWKLLYKPKTTLGEKSFQEIRDESVSVDSI